MDKDIMGILIATLIIIIWTANLLYSLSFVSVDFSNPLFYLHILLQGYLYTGLFITGHDAMHRTISKNKNINLIFGWISTLLFAGLSYNKLVKNHFKHHKNPGEETDPDFYTKSQNYFLWWGVFLLRYTTILQLIIMAAVFNILKIWFDQSAIIFFWVIPAFLGTFQLFFFGTYLPHKYPHTENMQPHNARTQKRNHLWAMISCYFFGYHHEHHESPSTPWWKLYKMKSR
ncbi:MAG TPA: fatty acid desaturase [Ignavibacteriaceae bacterium]|nr:fatty acid desaturase [Ignavibacteriaceae bacterium]HRP92089.1 fatty acid desaturase [Ignavibacteriaceae bacterium]HRQ54577.1 fatty acid desaturase [Ignavibacteriaceae bacterium]